MKYVIASFIALLTLSSCEKVIEPKDLPQQDPMLVVNSLIYSGSNVQVQVSSSKSILSGKDYKYIDNAVCDLYEDDVYLASASTGSNGVYTFPAQAKVGKKYEVQVGAGGFKSVSGKTTIPGNVIASPVLRYDTTVASFRLNEYGQGQKSIGGSSKFRFSITDDLSTRDFYGVRAVVVLYDSSNTSLAVDNVYISSGTGGGSGLEENNYYFYGESMGVDDQTLVNGREIKVDIEVNFNYNITPSTFDPKRIEVYLELSHASEEYYKYQKTLYEQASVGAGFFAEPVLVYNNIVNGAGIVAGVNNSSLVKIYPQ